MAIARNLRCNCRAGNAGRETRQGERLRVSLSHSFTLTLSHSLSHTQAHITHRQRNGSVPGSLLERWKTCPVWSLGNGCNSPTLAWRREHCTPAKPHTERSSGGLLAHPNTHIRTHTHAHIRTHGKFSPFALSFFFLVCRTVVFQALRVHPDWQGKGIAKQLSAALVQRLRDCYPQVKRLRICTSNSNKASLSIFQKQVRGHVKPSA